MENTNNIVEKFELKDPMSPTMADWERFINEYAKAKIISVDEAEGPAWREFYRRYVEPLKTK